MPLGTGDRRARPRLRDQDYEDDFGTIVPKRSAQVLDQHSCRFSNFSFSSHFGQLILSANRREVFPDGYTVKRLERCDSAARVPSDQVALITHFRTSKSGVGERAPPGEL